MSDNLNQISVQQARKLAEAAALRDVKEFSTAEPAQLLEDNHLEAESCWFFFRSRTITVPPEMWFTKAYSCYAISKKGTFSQIEDYSSDPERLHVYLQTMSDYFKRRGE